MLWYAVLLNQAGEITAKKFYTRVRRDHLVQCYQIIVLRVLSAILNASKKQSGDFIFLCHYIAPNDLSGTSISTSYHLLHFDQRLCLASIVS